MNRPQKPSRSPHGTNSRYVAGCSCLECCDAHAEYARSSRVGRTYVRQSVPTAVVRRHVLRLLDDITLSEISARSGLDRHTVSSIRDGLPRFVRRENAEAILGVTSAPVDPRVFECRECGHTVIAIPPVDKRTVYCSHQCEKAYWRRVSKKPTALTVHYAWEMQAAEARDAS